MQASGALEWQVQIEGRKADAVLGTVECRKAAKLRLIGLQAGEWWVAKGDVCHNRFVEYLLGYAQGADADGFYQAWNFPA
ncbi:hypothetical protein D9M70_483290 [compost metagenome]